MKNRIICGFIESLEVKIYFMGLEHKMPEQLNLLPSDWPPEEDFLLLIAKQLEWERYELYGMASLRKIYRFGVSYRNPRKEEEFKPIPKDLKFIIERGAKALKVSSKEIKQVLFTYV